MERKLRMRSRKKALDGAGISISNNNRDDREMKSVAATIMNVLEH